MNREAQLITHYYFCTGVIDRLSVGSRSPAELFGDGELELVQNLCHYSQIVSEIEHRKNDEAGFPGVFDYEVSEQLAAQLWVALCEQNPEFEPWDFPDDNRFRTLAERLIDDWIAECIPRELAIEDWLKRQLKKQPQCTGQGWQKMYTSNGKSIPESIPPETAFSCCRSIG